MQTTKELAVGLIFKTAGPPGYTSH